MIVGLGALVWAIVLIVRGESISIDFLRPINIVIAFLAFAVAMFERWLWKWRPFAWLVSMPDLNGTWRGSFKSDFKEPDGSPYPETISFLVVRQTLVTLSVRLITNRSNSLLASGKIEFDRDGIRHLVGVYEASSKALDHAENPPHKGAMILRIIGKPPRELDGSYWTDRKSKGELRLNDRVEAHVESYEEGLSAFDIS